MSAVVADSRTPEQLRPLGCSCEFGCKTCGWSLSGMGNCPAWNPCPVGRAPSVDCPIRDPDHRLGAPQHPDRDVER